MTNRIKGFDDKRIVNRLTILLLIFIFPIGIAFMWAFCEWRRRIKISISAFFAIVIAANIVASDKTDDTIFTTPYESVSAVYSDSIENPVWITSGGSKYHTEDCHVIKDNARSIPLEEALAKKLEPCSKCHPYEEDSDVENAIESSGDNIVWITKSGTKYHRQDCSSVRNGADSVTLDEALSRGLEPCGICKP